MKNDSESEHCWQHACSSRVKKKKRRARIIAKTVPFALKAGSLDVQKLHNS